MKASMPGIMTRHGHGDEHVPAVRAPRLVGRSAADAGASYLLALQHLRPDQPARNTMPGKQRLPALHLEAWAARMHRAAEEPAEHVPKLSR